MFHFRLKCLNDHGVGWIFSCRASSESKKKDALRAFVDLRSQVPFVVSWWHHAEHVKILTDRRFRAWNRPHKGNTCLWPAFPFRSVPAWCRGRTSQRIVKSGPIHSRI